MKNVILGIISCMLVVYTMVFSLSIYCIYSRKNEVEKCLSETLYSAMERHYMARVYQLEQAAASDEQVEFEVINDIEDRLSSDSEVEAIVYVCDMEKGIISAQVEEKFTLPMGAERTISCRKTIIVDREEL